MNIVNDKQIIIDLLNHYEILAMPTDTVYGLILKATKSNEVTLQHVKNRPETKPLPLVVDSVESLLNVIEVDEEFVPLINKYLPGGLTIVGKAKLDLNHDTLAVRVPDNKLMLEVVKEVGPCWLTSANMSGDPACYTCQQVMDTLESRINTVVDGECISAIPSTIISVVNHKVEVLRQGSVIVE